MIAFVCFQRFSGSVSNALCVQELCARGLKGLPAGKPTSGHAAYRPMQLRSSHRIGLHKRLPDETLRHSAPPSIKALGGCPRRQRPVRGGVIDEQQPPPDFSRQRPFQFRHECEQNPDGAIPQASSSPVLLSVFCAGFHVLIWTAVQTDDSRQIIGRDGMSGEFVRTVRFKRTHGVPAMRSETSGCLPKIVVVSICSLSDVSWC